MSELNFESNCEHEDKENRFSFINYEENFGVDDETEFEKDNIYLSNVSISAVEDEEEEEQKNTDYLILENQDILLQESNSESFPITQKVIFTDSIDSDKLANLSENTDESNSLRSKFSFWQAIEPEGGKLRFLIR